MTTGAWQGQLLGMGQGGRHCVTRRYFLPGISSEYEEGCGFLLLILQEPSRPEVDNSKIHLHQGGNRSEQRCLAIVSSSTFLIPTALLAYVSFFFFSLKHGHSTYFTLHLTLLLEQQQFKHMCQLRNLGGHRKWWAHILSEGCDCAPAHCCPVAWIF